MMWRTQKVRNFCAAAAEYSQSIDTVELSFLSRLKFCIGVTKNVSPAPYLFPSCRNLTRISVTHYSSTVRLPRVGAIHELPLRRSWLISTVE